jgi:hypothetical protein
MKKQRENSKLKIILMKILYLKKTNNKCSYCLKDLEFIDNDNTVKSDLTIDRIDNRFSHIKTNCKLSCLICNVSEK